MISFFCNRHMCIAIARMAVIALITIFSGGCLVVPLPHGEVTYTATEPRVVTPQMIALLKPGMTRQELLLEFGEPDFWWDAQRVFAYQWTMNTMDVLWVAAANGRAAGGDIQFLQFHTLLIDFDASGRVKHWEQFKSPSLALAENDATAPLGCSVLVLKARWHLNEGE